MIMCQAPSKIFKKPLIAEIKQATLYHNITKLESTAKDRRSRRRRKEKRKEKMKGRGERGEKEGEKEREEGRQGRKKGRKRKKNPLEQFLNAFVKHIDKELNCRGKRVGRGERRNSENNW